MASSRNSSTTLLLAIYCMVHVAAAVGAGLPAWTLPGSGGHPRGLSCAVIALR